MFLYEGDCLKNVTVIRGVRYVTVSHYSGDKDVCDKLGDMLTDDFRSCDLHEVMLRDAKDAPFYHPTLCWNRRTLSVRFRFQHLSASFSYSGWYAQGLPRSP